MAYLDSIGGSATNGIWTESEVFVRKGDFYRFNWTNANALCTTYNTHSLGGRTNWRLPTRDELRTELYDVYGNMFTVRGWPFKSAYWSSTSDGSNYYRVGVSDGNVISTNPSDIPFASCVSNP